MSRAIPDTETQRAARRRTDAYRHALSEQAITEALWLRKAKENGSVAGMCMHAAAVIRLANTLIHNAASAA